MALDTFLSNPATWAGYASDPANFARLHAFMRGIGASKYDVQRLGYYKVAEDRYAEVTRWYAPGYKARHTPYLLSLDDRNRDNAPDLAQKTISAHAFLVPEYNDALGIDYKPAKPGEDLLWLDAFADVVVQHGYPRIKTGEILSLLHREHDLGRGEMVFLDNRFGGDPIMFKPRPVGLLQANFRAAAILATAEHLNANMRWRYMSLTIPVDLLPEMILPSMPYDYVATLFPKRSTYKAGE